MLPDIRRRLVNAKYIVERASSIQTERHEMSLSLSILLMHDAVELLMLATLDHLSMTPKKHLDFMDFWGLTIQAGHAAPPDKLAMDRLNRMRVSLKHGGVLPNAAEARELIARSKGFFENVLTLYFGESYSDISLVDLVSDAEVRKLLTEARQKFLGGDKDAALIDLKVAFHKLRDPDDRMVPGIVAPARPALPNELKRAGWDGYLQSLHNFMEKSANLTNAVVLGIDPFRYENFISIGPILHWSVTGKYSAMFQRTYSDLPLEQFDELHSFLIDYAIKTSERSLAISDDSEQQESHN